MAVKSHLAFVFPGQGSQKVGMLSEIAEVWPDVTHTFAEASEVLGYDLWDRVQNGSQDTLNLTENAQPALLSASIALWRLLSANTDARPAIMAGHSLGEWSALVASGVIEFADAVKLVQLRGQFMQQAVGVGIGSMAAVIGLDDATIVDCCNKAAAAEVVAAVNFNSPGQVIIAGHADAVDRAAALCKSAGAKRTLPLAVSAPFHTTLMQAAADNLTDYIHQTKFSVPRVPVVHNVNAQTEPSPDLVKKLMIEQITAPVRWVECVQTMIKDGASEFVEVGPGKVLGGLIKRIDKSACNKNTDTLEALKSAF